MVAELMGRGQSGSPVNGEIPYVNSSMPASHGREELLNSPPSSPNSEYQAYNLSQQMKHKELFSQRKQREFIPDNKKDDSYWDRRRRNNEAAKRSREKRRFNDMVLEQRVVELTKENSILKAQLDAIREEFGICGENVCVEKVMSNLPTSEQVLSLTKRQKLSTPLMFNHPCPSPIPTPVIHQPVLGSPPPQPLPPLSHMLHHPQTHHEPPYREHTEYNPYFTSFHPVNPICDSLNNSVLNLSRSRSRAPSPYEISSNSGDECVPVTLTAAEANNSLPIKLRHKTHLGDKDAASALLSLQHIKQEPSSRASPPWDAEGSSDERDSGISLGGEWSASQAAATLQNLQKQSQAALQDSEVDPETKHRLHSEIVRLSTEVAHLKSIMIRKQSQVMKR